MTINKPLEFEVFSFQTSFWDETAKLAESTTIIIFPPKFKDVDQQEIRMVEAEDSALSGWVATLQASWVLKFN